MIMKAQLFRKKTVVISAIQFDGTEESISSDLSAGEYVWDSANMHLFINTLEGTLTASPGDWIIRGVKGEVYPCKPDIFEQTYEVIF